MAVEHAIDTFILTGDDPVLLDRVAAEVAPAVREAVADARQRAASATSADAHPAGPETDGAPASLVTAPPTPLGIVPTPDAGVRLSRVMRWDERTRPTAPPPDPATTYDDRGRAAGQHLIDVHDHLRSELSKVRDIVRQVQAGQRTPHDARDAIAKMTLRQNDWIMGAYCASYCRVVATHHSIEDESILPYLRRTEAGLRPVLDRLEEEHRVIHGVIEEVDAALVAWIERPGEGESLDAAVDALTDTLLSHLSYEERELVEPLARHGFYEGQL
jgi:hemerythrin-like domain-containing protein